MLPKLYRGVEQVLDSILDHTEQSRGLRQSVVEDPCREEIVWEHWF